MIMENVNCDLEDARNTSIPTNGSSVNHSEILCNKMRYFRRLVWVFPCDGTLFVPTTISERTLSLLLILRQQ